MEQPIQNRQEVRQFAQYPRYEDFCSDKVRKYLDSVIHSFQVDIEKVAEELDYNLFRQINLPDAYKNYPPLQSFFVWQCLNIILRFYMTQAYAAVHAPKQFQPGDAIKLTWYQDYLSSQINMVITQCIQLTQLELNGACANPTTYGVEIEVSADMPVRQLVTNVCMIINEAAGRDGSSFEERSPVFSSAKGMNMYIQLWMRNFLLLQQYDQLPNFHTVQISANTFPLHVNVGGVCDAITPKNIAALGIVDLTYFVSLAYMSQTRAGENSFIYPAAIKTPSDVFTPGQKNTSVLEMRGFEVPVMSADTGYTIQSMSQVLAMAQKIGYMLSKVRTQTELCQNMDHIQTINTQAREIILKYGGLSTDDLHPAYAPEDIHLAFAQKVAAIDSQQFQCMQAILKQLFKFKLL